jgi:hypothetical protein
MDAPRLPVLCGGSFVARYCSFDAEREGERVGGGGGGRERKRERGMTRGG